MVYMVYSLYTKLKNFFGYNTEDNVRKRSNPGHDDFATIRPPKQRCLGVGTYEDKDPYNCFVASKDFLHPISSNITQNVKHHSTGVISENTLTHKDFNSHLHYANSDRMDGVIEVSDDECEEVVEVEHMPAPRLMGTSLRRTTKASIEIPPTTFYGKGSSSRTFNLDMEENASAVRRKTKSSIPWKDYENMHKNPFRITSSNRSGGKSTKTLRDAFPLCQWSSAQKENTITVTDDDDDDGVEVCPQPDWISPDLGFKTPRVGVRPRMNMEVGTSISSRVKLARKSIPNQDEIRVVKVVESRNARLKEKGLYPFPTPSPILPSKKPVFLPPSRHPFSPSVVRQSSHSMSSHSSSKSTGGNEFFKKSTALNESFCIKDKLKYSALLRHCTQFPKITDRFKSRNTGMLSATTSHLKLGGKPQLSGLEMVEVVDLTKIDKKKPAIVAAKVQDDDIEISVGVECQRLPSTSATKKVSDFEIDKKKSSQLFMRNVFSELKDPKKLYNPNDLSDIFEKYEQGMLEKEKKIYHRELEAELSRSSLVHDFIDDKLMTKMRLYDTSDAEEEKPLPELTPEIQKRIDAALRPNPSNEVLVEAFSIRITRRDMNTLAGLHWLNDEVINFYMNLLMERGKLDNYPSVYAFNTFFYPKLTSGGHTSLKRWTRKVDVFSHDLNIVPIHLGMHWCMAAIDYRSKEIRYYDSMGGDNNQCLGNLLKYLQDESLDKKKKSFETSGWTTTNIKDIPQQMNGSDCGMFSCMYAEYNCRDAPISFTQTDMPYFRKKMVYEIVTAKLML